MLKKLCLPLVGVALLGLMAPALAQKEKKVEKTAEDVQQERLRQLLTAYDLAAQGRTKNAPEYLITAAGLLRELSTLKDLQEMKPLDAQVEVTGEDRPAPADKQAAVPSLARQAEDLFQEASDMGASLK